MKKTITLEVNGVSETAEVEVGETLLRFLRDGLDLTGTKEGCNEGECGSCMVLLDGRPVNSCLVLAVEADGRSVTTVEGRPWIAAIARPIIQARPFGSVGIVDSRTAYTDGGPALPGLALVCDGRFIPLDQLGSRELIAEVLRWENLPVDAPGCFVIRN